MAARALAALLCSAALLELASPTSSIAQNDRRYLIVLTARPGDLRVQAQRAQIAELKAQGDERDLELVVVAQDSPKLLRRRGGFETVLLGKDGGVKRRSSGIMAAAELKDLIDAMPMRREEVSRREKAKAPP